MSEATPVCQIINTVLRRLGPWHEIEFHSIGPSVIDLSISRVRVEIRASEWFAGHRRIVASPMRIDFQMSDQDRFFIQHISGILNDLETDRLWRARCQIAEARNIYHSPGTLPGQCQHHPLA